MSISVEKTVNKTNDNGPGKLQQLHQELSLVRMLDAMQHQPDTQCTNSHIQQYTT